MHPSQSVNVFVVDDEPVIGSTLAVILNRSGYTAISFTNHALKEAGISTPTLLISDVFMPQMTGVELAIQIRAIAPEVKLLLFSGQAATSNLLEEAKMSGYDFTLLSKPIHPADLFKAIRGEGDLQ